MDEEISDTMNLDLNLGPAPEPEPEPELEPASGSNEPVNLDERMDEPIHGPAPELVSFSTAHEPVDLDGWMVEPHRIMEGLRQRGRHRWRWQHDRVSPEAQNISMELNQLMVNSGNASNILQAGEGSVAAGERTSEVTKTCENGNGIPEEETSENKDEIEKGSGSDGSFFDCNICLDLARDPVVTCCGHLFCWSCIYRWLHVHSDAKECPVCKGEVTHKNVTPIYGRGNHLREPDEDSSLKIPPRPHGRRVESLRQTIQRTALSIPVEEMIRRLGSRFDLTRDLIQSQEATESAIETAERASLFNNSLLNRILTSRARRENIVAPPTDDAVDLMQSSLTTHEAGENRPLLLLRRTITQRTPLTSLPSLSSQLNERYVESYFRSHPTGRNQQEQPPPPSVDDRDSFSSIAAVINSESQMDTAVEIDSVSLSTSSSRRRNDASRISDVDSGDSRTPRRRRLN
ncbi:hypothetical protein FNV43_RR16572 [Rhamnella rubrinervis]|uniref:E3 ubiquitin-protein ligase RMA n=1 Tax=Rhamnella rubrinervis TaxID=2594499 RepID=A0A8K0MDF6_9ROSA|nr:hypothetical protein FNV43_RR16572 [Rhamnella rubrinervis]